MTLHFVSLLSVYGFFFFFFFCVWAHVQPPLGRAFFFFQYDIDFLYDFIRLIPSLPPSKLSQSHLRSHTQMPVMPAFPPSNQSRQLVFGSMASMRRLQHWKWKMVHSEKLLIYNVMSSLAVTPERRMLRTSEFLFALYVFSWDTVASLCSICNLRIISKHILCRYSQDL